jgi:hypothetical protein
MLMVAVLGLAHGALYKRHGTTTLVCRARSRYGKAVTAKINAAHTKNRLKCRASLELGWPEERIVVIFPRHYFDIKHPRNERSSLVHRTE